MNSERRNLLKLTGAGIAVASIASMMAAPASAQSNPVLSDEWDKTFAKSDKVEHKKVTFKNRYGLVLAADVYQPKNVNQPLAAIVLSGPFGAVKEQSSGLYAQVLADRGFMTLAFDPSFTGESGGEPRHVASADIYTEDFSAAIDFLGMEPDVDRNRIGVLAICGLSGMALTAATSDSRIKAVATVSMYDMSRSISRGYQDGFTVEERKKVIDYLSQQRWEDAKSGHYALGYHEVPFDKNGNIIKGQRILPETLSENAPTVLAAFFDYYRTTRGFHPRSINSTSAWTATTPISFFNFPMHANIEMISPRPILLIAGENAHSRYYSEDVYNAALEPKELLIVENADHVDLYDDLNKIPIDKLSEFFQQNL